MIAVDTNVPLRLVVEDDIAQTDRAVAVFDGGAVLVPKTVLVEMAWTLRTGYRYDRAAIAHAITALMGLPGVLVEDGPAVKRALSWQANGLDFADALHLASSSPAHSFATFDRALQRRAKSLEGAIPVVAP